LDTTLTHELKEEGWLRELIRIVQGMRQNAGLEPKDVIRIFGEFGDELKFIVEKNKKDLLKEVNAKSIEYQKAKKFKAELETKLDEWQIWLAIKKVK